MKKLRIATLVLTFAVMSSTTVFAADNTKKKSAPIDNLQLTNYLNTAKLSSNNITNNEVTTNGIGSPSNKWTLENGSYSYSINSLLRSVSTNYYFMTSTGKIKITTNFKPKDPNEISNNIHVYLYKKGGGPFGLGDSIVKSKYVTSSGSDSITFTGLSTSDKYYFTFEKGDGNIAVEGSGKISE